MRRLVKAVEALLELLYPSRCAFCHRFTGGEKVCGACLRDLPWTEGREQRQKFPFISCCVRASLLRYKFGGLRFYGKIYSEILSKCVDGNGISCDIITWVPLSGRRRRSRGYDQARLIAEGLAERLALPCRPLLKKTRHNPAQSGTGSPEKRRANVSGVYAAADPALTEGKRVLLVDDIVTTGATLSECARVLQMAGAASVCAAAVARHRPVRAPEERKTKD